MKTTITFCCCLLLFVSCTTQAPTTEPTPMQPAATLTEAPTITPEPSPTVTLTSTPLPTSTPTLSPTPLPSPTDTATPTPMPGVQVIPITSMKSSIPWLPLNTAARPGIQFLGFNTVKPPFDNPIIRQAFATAVDRQVIVELFDIYYPEYQARLATTFIPPETLGRDLTGEIGITYDPQRAKALLDEAGYTDPSKFPTVTLFQRAWGFAEYPGFRVKLEEALKKMWQDALGVEVIIVMTTETHGERFANNPPDIYWLGLVADVNDPTTFIEAFISGQELNFGHYSNFEFDRLIRQARGTEDPLTRQSLYIEAERLLTEIDVPVIPMVFNTRDIP